MPGSLDGRAEADADQHDVLAAAFTDTGTLTYDLAEQNTGHGDLRVEATDMADVWKRGG